jgi:hypothetical protein
MLVLLQFFIDLARLRRGPQDLPYSSALLVLLAMLSVLTGTINGRELFGGVQPAFGANLVDLALSLGLLWVLLKTRNKAARWQQTASAFLGLGVLAGLVMFVVRTVAEAFGVIQFAILLDLVVAVWLHVALGNVLRQAIEVPLLAGVLIVLAYTVFAFNLIAQVFPPQVMAQ